MNAIAIPARLPKPADAVVSAEEWQVLTDVIFPTAKTATAISTAVRYCRARKLDVFKRPVSIVSMWNSSLRREVETVWPGINEIQVTAARAGWAGMDEPKWGPDTTRTFKGRVRKKEGGEQNVEASVTFPEWCCVTVYRMVGGQRCAFGEPVYWLESYATIGRTEVPNEMWRKRTRGQLLKCAKAASLRAAFPEAGGVVIDGVTAEIVPPQAQEPQFSPEHDPTAPEYRVATNNGGRVFHTGTEFINFWTAYPGGLIARCQKADALDKLRAAWEMNRGPIEAVREFDPRAAEEVENAIRAALGEVAPEQAPTEAAPDQELADVVPF